MTTTLNEGLYRRITIIEDSKESQSRLCGNIPFGVEIQMISSAPFFDEKIEAAIIKFRPDLIILDMSLVMSTDSGFRVLRDIKKKESLKHLPVVIFSKSISHDPDDSYKKKATNLGAVAALPKIPLPDLATMLMLIRSSGVSIEVQVESC